MTTFLVQAISKQEEQKKVELESILSRYEEHKRASSSLRLLASNELIIN